MKRYADVDKLIEELNQTYKGSMADMAMMPFGVENWLNDHAHCIAEMPEKYRPLQDEVAVWREQMDELHEKRDLDSTIKELSVICAHYEENHMDILQTDCYRRALGFLMELKGLITG